MAGELLLEIGFGPGLGIAALAVAAPELRIAGVDPSELMLPRRAGAPDVSAPGGRAE